MDYFGLKKAYFLLKNEGFTLEKSLKINRTKNLIGEKIVLQVARLVFNLPLVPRNGQIHPI